MEYFGDFRGTTTTGAFPSKTHLGAESSRSSTETTLRIAPKNAVTDAQRREDADAFD
jgi:hypothetical protein